MVKFKLFRFPMIITALIFVIISCEDNNDDDNSPNNNQIKEPEKDIIVSAHHLGICYGPFYKDGQSATDPNCIIPVSQIEHDLSLIVKHFDFIRTYTVANGLDQVVAVAKDKGLEVALGVHVYPGNSSSTHTDIETAVNLAQNFQNTVKAIVIGNETVLGSDKINPDTVAGYMNYAKTKLGNLEIPITACLQAWAVQHGGETIVEQCRDLNAVHHQVIFLTVYPYYGQREKYLNENTPWHPGDISGNMNWSYYFGGIQAAENYGLEVIFGEIGWPGGSNRPDFPTDTASELLNLNKTLDWVDGHNFLKQAYNAYWFEMFDEPWKTGEPEDVGPHWGLYTSGENPQPKFTIPTQ